MRPAVTKVAPKIAFIKHFWRFTTTTKRKGRYILYINFILRQIMKLTLHLFVHFRHFSLVCSICRVHYVHNYTSLHSFQKENYVQNQIQLSRFSNILLWPWGKNIMVHGWTFIYLSCKEGLHGVIQFEN